MNITAQLAEPWHVVEAMQADKFVIELFREVCPQHPLHGQHLKAIARRSDCDDVLFEIGKGPDRFAVVHLTWSGKRETSPEWPSMEFFENFNQFVERRLKPDAVEYKSTS